MQGAEGPPGDSRAAEGDRRATARMVEPTSTVEQREPETHDPALDGDNAPSESATVITLRAGNGCGDRRSAPR